MKYYSIRVIEAESQEEAIEKIQDGEFLEEDELCDEVLTADELLERLTMREEGYIQSFLGGVDILAQAERDGVQLSDEEVRKVAEFLSKMTHIGINWDSISTAISTVKGNLPEIDQKIDPAEFYLVYLNHFLTVTGIAESYNISKEEALILINKGREAHSAN
jgi:hypothetical protein